MAGRINDEDVAEVRARARIDDIISSYVTLRRAGTGTLKGLCPFHDEKTPSFQVTPAKGFFHCFGCGEGGDVITFLQKINNVTFVEAVEQLADKVGVQLRRDDDGPRVEPGLRTRVLEANAAADEYFRSLITAPEALVARQFLDSRGFDRAAAERFGVGWAPASGRELGAHLQRAGFSRDHLVKARLINDHGYDFFQGRLLWPIRDSGGQVIGFGARRLRDDDRLPAKYINTPETIVYKKSSVLYGLDLARRAIGQQHQAVVVEGYTDVMAAHLAGVETAVASCGTAFGSEHARLLQRLLGDHGTGAGSGVVFTFDGDEAGQKAAMKVFENDARFIGQTYVAVDPNGLDPCDLRLAHGDAAVRELVARRVPLYEFVMRNVLRRHDLDHADGRVAALREAAPLVGSIRDEARVHAYERELAGMIGVDPADVRREVERARRAPRPSTPETVRVREPEPAPRPQGIELPEADDHRLDVERGTLKLALQAPTLFWSAPEPPLEADFSHPAYRAVWAGVAAERARANASDLVDHVRAAMPDEGVAQLVVALTVEPLLREPDAAYVEAYITRLRFLTTMRAIGDLKSKLQRTNPVDDDAEYNRMFTRLLALEERRAALQAEMVNSEI